MSGPPKKVHEEGSHSTPSKRPLEDIGIYSNLSGKHNQPGSSEFHLPYEHTQDGRFPKVHHVESRDDKRPSLTHRLPIASTSIIDHSISSESRLEAKSSRDARETKLDDQMKSDNRDAHAELRLDPQSRKIDDLKMDAKVDESETRSDRKLHVDHKNDIKFEKDYHLGTGSYVTWKDNKDQHRSKRYIESPGDASESWRFGRSAPQSTDEAKLPTMMDTRNIKDAHETSADGKLDIKGEEKSREKKRKDEKHRDFTEREKDRNERRISMQPGNTTNERRELHRDDRESDKWDKERKDLQKDKEAAEKDKEFVKKDLPITTEKESVPSERVTTEAVLKTSEHENSLADPRTGKDDQCRADRDFKDRKREREGETVDRQDQRNRSHNDKDADEMCTEGDSEKDKEVFGSVMQRRRMLRSRGSQQGSQREPRFRSKIRDNDGSQGKTDVSMIVYKAGDCMQELMKSWKEFEASQDNSSAESSQSGPTLEIRIPAEYVTSTNRQVKGAQLWGTDVYTNDSDLVAVLMHTGYCSPTSSPPPSAIQELRATVRVLPPQDCYNSTLRNNVRSRAWGAGIGCSFRIERCCIVKKFGGTIDLEPRLSHTSAVEPTLAPVSAERTMTTRAAASNARFVREVTIQYNLCNEPWLKYCISIVADKGLKKSLYTSARLKKGEVIYLETHVSRYELCYSGEKPAAVCNGSNHSGETDQEKHHQTNNSHAQNGDKGSTDQDSRDVFRWSRCKKPMPESSMRSIGIPLPVEHLEVLEENLEWEDVQWSQTGVWVASKEYPLARVHFLSGGH